MRYRTQVIKGPRAAVIALSLSFLFTDQGLGADQVRTGADQILREPYYSWIKGKRVGLITNQTGVNSRLESLISILEDRPNIRLTALFGPEHGIEGGLQAGQKVAHSQNVFSLYGDHRAPTTAMLTEVDVLVYDIQDIGARFYTYISTLYECMQAAAEQRIPFIVLDRPNPLGGIRTEGPVLKKGFESFVGIYPISIRYGMTAGELALFLCAETGLDLELKVVPLCGWDRSQWFDETGLEWLAPSPNIPTLKAATLYPGFCLIEGTNLSEGRGTTQPFELIGAPWLNAAELARRLNNLRIPGTRFRPQSFTPSFSKYQGERCKGVQIHVLDRALFEPIPTALYLLRETMSLHPEKLRFRSAHFDRLVGNRWIRNRLLQRASVASIVAQWKQSLDNFKTKRLRYLLY
jgi:uncharacterized protein YbbC (DUF1343 family)